VSRLELEVNDGESKPLGVGPGESKTQVQRGIG